MLLNDHENFPSGMYATFALGTNLNLSVSSTECHNIGFFSCKNFKLIPLPTYKKYLTPLCVKLASTAGSRNNEKNVELLEQLAISLVSRSCLPMKNLSTTSTCSLRTISNVSISKLKII